MRIQTILNRVEKFKPFVVGEASLEAHGDGPARIVQMRPRKNGRVSCSSCGRPGPVYDGLEERRFESMPIWGILVFLAYRMRRVNC
jgi:transposase